MPDRIIFHVLHKDHFDVGERLTILFHPLKEECLQRQRLYTTQQLHSKTLLTGMVRVLLQHLLAVTETTFILFLI